MMRDRYYIVYKLKVLSGPHTKLEAAEKLEKLQHWFLNLECWEGERETNVFSCLV
jgi:hypothetical protein